MHTTMESGLDSGPDVNLAEFVHQKGVDNPFRHQCGEVVVEKIGRDESGMERYNRDVAILAAFCKFHSVKNVSQLGLRIRRVRLILTGFKIDIVETNIGISQVLNYPNLMLFGKRNYFFVKLL